MRRVRRKQPKPIGISWTTWDAIQGAIVDQVINEHVAGDGTKVLTCRIRGRTVALAEHCLSEVGS